jgi:hypothetical protein
MQCDLTSLQIQALTGGILLHRNGGARPRARKAIKRHTTVDCLVFASFDPIGLVPNTHVTSAVFQSPIKFNLCGPMKSVGAASMVFKVPKASPILDNCFHTQSGVAEKADLWRRCIQLFQHSWHSGEYRPPLADFPRLVDPHSNEENDEISADMRRRATSHDLRHHFRSSKYGQQKSSLP